MYLSQPKQKIRDSTDANKYQIHTWSITEPQTKPNQVSDGLLARMVTIIEHKNSSMFSED
jgi:hypothetical protein